MEELDQPNARASLPRCDHCGELIGVYEPLVVNTGTGWRTTSLAAEPDLGTGDLRLLHLACTESATDAIA